jgi:Trk K+ transport system NAD-binding subunit
MALQGSTIALMGKWMRVKDDGPAPMEFSPYVSARKSNEFIEFEIPRDSLLVGHTLFDLQLPEDVLVVLIHREDEDFIPRGNTVLRARDRLVCLVNKRSIPQIVELLRDADPRIRKLKEELREGFSGHYS